MSVIVCLLSQLLYFTNLRPWRSQGPNIRLDLLLCPDIAEQTVNLTLELQWKENKHFAEQPGQLKGHFESRFG